MGKLEYNREKIDLIDKNIIKLLLARLKLVRQISVYKKKNKIKITDKKRERNIIINIKKYSNKKHQKFFKKIFGCIINYSKKIQK